MRQVTNRALATIDLLGASPAKLDSLELPDLLAIVRASDTAHQANAEQDFALDRVYLVKVVRLLMTGSSSTADVVPLSNHLSKVCTLRRRTNLSTDRQTIVDRWKVLLELLDIAGDFMLAREKSATPTTASSKVAWETVADILLSHRTDGIRWGTLASKLMASEIGPSSKGGVSQLVTSMRAAGWLEATSHGREKIIHAGPKIHLSAVWQRAFPSEEKQEVVRYNGSGEALTSIPSYARTIEILQETMCRNQSSLIETFYLASDKHRLLKESGAGYKEREGLHRKLLTYLNDSLVTTASENFNHLKQYFRLRGSQPPRMCIKGNWTDSINEQQFIVDVLRDRPSDRASESPRIEDNTGFVKVRESGRYVLINNIPKAALSEGYKNPRLNASRFQELVSAKGIDATGSPAISKGDWISCWDTEKNPDPMSCYRSTLIIPITLTNNELSKDFVNSLEHRIRDRELPSIGRIILGYLCFDHEEVGYFDPMMDKQLGYIFADILSIYLFMRYNYTQLSKTVQKVHQFRINAAETMEEALKKARLHPPANQISDDLESENNYLVPVDQAIFQGRTADTPT